MYSSYAAGLVVTTGVSGEGDVDAGGASRVIVTDGGMKPVGAGVETEAGVERFDLQDRAVSRRTRISRFIQLLSQ